MKICNTCWDKFIKNEPIYPKCPECRELNMKVDDKLVWCPKCEVYHIPPACNDKKIKRESF